MSTSPTVPMYAPDGTLGDVPYEQMHAALQAGGKMGVNMTAPDGTQGVIPADKTQEAVKAGGKIVPYNMESQPEKEGFISHVGQSLKQAGQSLAQPPPATFGEAVKKGLEASTGALPMMIGAGKEFVGALKRGHDIPYSAAAGASSLVGVNPERMEKAAEQGDTAGVLGEAAVPTALAVGGGVASKIAKSLPSAKAAGASLQDIRATAGHVPIEMSGPGDTALQIYYEAKHGAFLPKPVNDLLKRMGLDPDELKPNNRPISYDAATNRGALDPNTPPLTYAEAKSFQSNISSLTTADKLTTNANIKRLVTQLNGRLKDSLEGAAETYGKGQQFTDAMKEYHEAMTLKGFSEKAIEYTFKAALAGLGLGAVEKVRKMIP